MLGLHYPIRVGGGCYDAPAIRFAYFRGLKAGEAQVAWQWQ